MIPYAGVLSHGLVTGSMPYERTTGGRTGTEEVVMPAISSRCMAAALRGIPHISVLLSVVGARLSPIFQGAAGYDRIV